MTVARDDSETSRDFGQVTAGLPESLDEIARDFAALSARDRLTLLSDFSDELPALPERYQGHTELLERVEACQSPPASRGPGARGVPRRRWWNQSTPTHPRIAR
jgi:hypothetical protein